jgi:hypothetical protein
MVADCAARCLNRTRLQKKRCAVFYGAALRVSLLARACYCGGVLGCGLVSDGGELPGGVGVFPGGGGGVAPGGCMVPGLGPVAGLPLYGLPGAGVAPGSVVLLPGAAGFSPGVPGCVIPG